MINRKIIIIDARSLGIMTLDAALEMNRHKSIYFIDDNIEKNSHVFGYKVIGTTNDLKKFEDSIYDFVIAIANNKVRKKIANENELNYINIIHPKVAISRFSRIKGTGNI